MNVGIVDFEVDPNGEDLILPDGRRFADLRFVLEPEAVARIRTGYQCVRCFEVFETAWPTSCRMCHLNVDRDQRPLFEREYSGPVVLPPRGVTADELARGEEEYLHKVKEARL